jgi:hypothetical protein
MLKNNQTSEQESRLKSGLLKSLSASPQLAKLWPLALVGLTLLALIILAGGLPGFKPQSGGPFPFWLFNRLEPGQVAYEPILPQQGGVVDFWRILGLTVIGILLIAWIITFILHPEARRRLLTRMVIYVLLVLAIYQLYQTMRSIKIANEGKDGDPPIQPEALLKSVAPPAVPEFINNPPAWLVTAITLAVIALALGVVWWLWQRRGRSLTREDPLARLALHAQQAVDTLQAGSDGSDAVLRCYYNMSQALREQRGVTRQAGMTAREFEEHLAKLGLGDDHIHRLTRLFESVRYGAHVTTERDKREAIDCLNAIVRLCSKSA